MRLVRSRSYTKNGVFGMLSRVALVRTDVSEERTSSFIRVTTIVELGATNKTNSVDLSPQANYTD
jgi:hypothetical protein